MRALEVMPKSSLLTAAVSVIRVVILSSRMWKRSLSSPGKLFGKGTEYGITVVSSVLAITESPRETKAAAGVL